MNRSILLSLAWFWGTLWVVLAARASEPTSLSFRPEDEPALRQEVRVVVDLLQNYHYLGRTFADFSNTEIIEHFLDELDRDGRFLTCADRDFLRNRFGRTLMTVYLFRGDLKPALEMTDLFLERVRSRCQWIEGRLMDPVDLSAEGGERISALPVPHEDDEEADRVWEIELRDRVRDLVAAGWSESESSALLRNEIGVLRKRWTSLDVLSVREWFLDSLIRMFDPHSGYFSSESAQVFEEALSGSGVGVGLEARARGGRWHVGSILPGGPADQSGRLFLDDEIVAVSHDGRPFEVLMDRPLRSVLSALRGTVGETIVLEVKRAESVEAFQVALECRRVVNPAGRARAGIYWVPDEKGGSGRKIGWIGLPSFYQADGSDDPTSSSTDLRLLLGKMIERQIAGLVIDLRGNGGGAMPQVSEVLGLFLSAATVMQTRSVDGDLESHISESDATVYGGPLVVLTSMETASASEVFAGALRFYDRAVIVGGEGTFGKGTAQAFVDLGSVLAETGDALGPNGVLRMTTMRLYLPDGDALQFVGVPSHIVIPGMDRPGMRREPDLLLALPAESIQPPSVIEVRPKGRGYRSVSAEEVSELVARFEGRAGTLRELVLWKNLVLPAAGFSSDKPRATEREPLLPENGPGGLAWRAEWRSLKARPFRWEPIDLPEVSRALRNHAEWLSMHPLPDRSPRVNRVFGGTFHAETNDGGVRSIPIAAIQMKAFLADVDTLTEAFSKGSGLVVRPETIAEAMEKSGTGSERSLDFLVECYRSSLDGAGDRMTIIRGIEALLARLVSLEPDLSSERPVFEIPVREALRVAADLAELWERQAEPDERDAPVPTESL